MTAIVRALLALLLALAAGSSGAAELRVALGQQAPVPKETPAGDAAPPRGADLGAVNNDMAREICRRLQAQCAFHQVPVAAILAGVENGGFDLGFGPFLYSAERARHVAFSDPIWRSSSRLLARRGVGAAFAVRLGAPVSLDSLRDARVATIEGSAQYDFLAGIAAEQRLRVVTMKTAVGTVDLLGDDADFALLPVPTAYGIVARDNAQQLEFVGPPAADRGLGGTVHIALPRGREDLRKAVNQAIAATRADGTFQRIVRQYFPVGLD